MCFDLLKQCKIFSSICRTAYVYITLAVSSNQFTCIACNNYAAYSYIILIFKVSSSICLQIPYSDSTALITKYNLDLIRMQHSTVDHDSIIVKITHVPSRLEVKYLESTILTRCEEPLVILLESD